MNTEEKIWDLTQAINVKGVWYGCKHAVIAMRNVSPLAMPQGLADAQNKDEPEKGLHKGGSVINVASFVAKLGAATPQLAYTASKGAVLAMTRELAMIHAREGIRFNSLCPGPIRTPLLMDFLNTPEKLNRRMVHCPMGRFGEAVEQAKAVVFREYEGVRCPRVCRERPPNTRNINSSEVRMIQLTPSRVRRLVLRQRLRLHGRRRPLRLLRHRRGRAAARAAPGPALAAVSEAPQNRALALIRSPRRAQPLLIP